MDYRNKKQNSIANIIIITSQTDDNDMNKKSLRTHPDAIEGMNKKIEASVETYESVKLEIQNSQQRPEILRPNSRSEQI